MLTSKWMAHGQEVLPIGVDIGHSGVKMVQLAHVEDDVSVLSVGRAPMTLSDSIDEGERRRRTVAAIRQLLLRGRFRGRRAVSVLSGEDLQITSLRLTEAESLQAEKVLQREAAQRFNQNADGDAVDYLLAGSVRQDEEVKNEYIVLAARGETIENHVSLLEEAGLQPVAIDAAPCALFRSFERAMRREEDKQRTVIFMDVGQRHTTVVFGRNSEICLAKQMPFGTSRFDAEIAAKLEMTVPDAEALRLRLQRDESVEACTRSLLTDALVSVAEQMARELSLCLRYHTVTFRGKRVERAVVAGGGAHEKMLLDVLQRHLSITVAPADPLRGMNVQDPRCADECARSSADLAIAIGLSLKERSPSLPRSEPVEMPPEPVLEGEPS
jgi:type IV pilus assembly protein PilM